MTTEHYIPIYNLQTGEMIKYPVTVDESTGTAVIGNLDCAKEGIYRQYVIQCDGSEKSPQLNGAKKSKGDNVSPNLPFANLGEAQLFAEQIDDICEMLDQMPSPALGLVKNTLARIGRALRRYACPWFVFEEHRSKRRDEAGIIRNPPNGDG